MAAKQAEQSLLELWKWAGRVEPRWCLVEQPCLHSTLLVPMIWSDGETLLLDQCDQNNRAVGEEHRAHGCPRWLFPHGQMVSLCPHTQFSCLIR